MNDAFVTSNFERIAGDYYPTIDKRCIYALLEHYCFDGLKCVDVCAPNGSGIVDTLQECEVVAYCLPDAFADNIKASWIITNPPFDRPLVDQIINRQIERVDSGEVQGLAVLLRSYFDHAKTRAGMFSDCPFYAGQIRLRFRPWWSEQKTKQPIHNFVWQIWTQGAAITSPVVMYADGIRPVKAQPVAIDSQGQKWQQMGLME